MTPEWLPPLLARLDAIHAALQQLAAAPPAVAPPDDDAIDWSATPQEWTLDDVVQKTGESKATVYGKLARHVYPIRALPREGLGSPYRFRRDDVRAWIKKGEVTNPQHPSKQRALRRIG